MRAFVDGVTAASTGAMALVDVTTVLIAVATWLLFTRFKKLPEPLVIVASGIVGLLLKAR